MTSNLFTHTICKQCDYASVLAGNWRRHLKFHSGEKSFKCNQCDYASVHSHNLIRRLKTQSEEKSCKCNQCDYASVHSDGLRRHLKTNSGKKSFKCNQCDFGSVHSDDLRTHLKLTMEKSCTNATMHLFWQSIWEDIWKLNLEKNRSNATNATNASRQPPHRVFDKKKSVLQDRIPLPSSVSLNVGPWVTRLNQVNLMGRTVWSRLSAGQRPRSLPWRSFY